MATIINADTSNGLKLTSDTSGLIEFQSGGVTKAGVNATGLTGDASQLTAIPAGASLSTASGSAPSYSARAWVCFTGNAAAADMIRDSENVSTMTDRGTGKYTVNFITNMPNANYAVAGSAGTNDNNLNNVGTPFNQFPQSVSACPINTCHANGSNSNPVQVSVIIFI